MLGYLAADAATLILLARVLKPTARVRPLVLLSLRANFVGGTTSFGGVEIPYQAFSLRRQGLTLPEATSVILVKGVVHTSVLVARGPDRPHPCHRLADHALCSAGSWWPPWC